MSIQNVGKVINIEREAIIEVAKLDFAVQATAKVIDRDLLITLTGGDTLHIGTVTTFPCNTEIQTVRFPSRDGCFHKDSALAERIAVITKNAVSGSCIITSGIHVDHTSNMQINASLPMSEELDHKILDWLEKTDFHIKEPVYCTDGERPL